MSPGTPVRVPEPDGFTGLRTARLERLGCAVAVLLLSSTVAVAVAAFGAGTPRVDVPVVATEEPSATMIGYTSPPVTLPAHAPPVEPIEPAPPGPPSVTLRVYDAPAIRMNGSIDISGDPHAGYCARGHTGSAYDDDNRNSGAPPECESVGVTWVAPNNTERVHLWAILIAPDGSKRFPVDLGNHTTFGKVMYGKSPHPELWEPGNYTVHFSWHGNWSGSANVTVPVDSPHTSGQRHHTDASTLVRAHDTTTWATSPVAKWFKSL